MKDKITVIGSGAMATAVAKVAYDSGYKNISIYGIDKTEIEELSKGMNTRYFPNSVELPEFETTTDLKIALEDAKYIILAVPSKVIGMVLTQLLSNLVNEVTIINVAKGFFPGTKESLHEGISNLTKDNSKIKGVVSLIGPSHAEEMVKKAPTIVAVVGEDKAIIEDVQKIFTNDYFRTYMQTDIKGAEVGAAYKNVLAIASGISTGLGYGINTKAALLTRGLAEMIRFNKVMKGKTETIIGLTGIGDLIVTAMSDLSRNFTFGVQFAKEGKKALNTNATVEGLIALDVIYEIAKEKNVELPIIEYLYEVIHKDKDIEDIVKSLWSRKLKPE